MRMLGSDSAFSCHPCMAERMRSRHRRKVEAADHLVRPTLLLEDLDALAEAHRPHRGKVRGKPSAQRFRLRPYGNDAVAAAVLRARSKPEFLVERGIQLAPIEVGIGMEQRGLVRAQRRA